MRGIRLLPVALVAFSAPLLTGDESSKLPTDPKKLKPPEYVEARFKPDLPPALVRSLTEMQVRRRKGYDDAIEEARGAISRVHQAKRGANSQFRSKAHRLREVKLREQQLKTKLAELDQIATNPTYVPTFDAPRSGSIGRFNGPMRALEVISATEVIAEARLGLPHAEWVWLAKIDSGGVKIGEEMRFEESLIVSGTKAHRTVDGKLKSLLIFEPVDVKPFLDIEADSESPAAK